MGARLPANAADRNANKYAATRERLATRARLPAGPTAADRRSRPSVHCSANLFIAERLDHITCETHTHRHHRSTAARRLANITIVKANYVEAGGGLGSEGAAFGSGCGAV